jgi:exodeoxyribonuclease-3
MRVHIMSWNIRHGGGSRAADILEVIAHHRPDLVLLSEFRNNSVAPQICGGLEQQRLAFQAAPGGSARELSVLLASRLPFDPHPLERELSLWPFRAIRGDLAQFVLFGFYVPTGERKRPVLHFMRDLAPQFLRRKALLVGDFNTGIPRLDERGAELTCSAEFAEVLMRGWIDLWRVRNPLSRERSYYERPWLGYRIDHALGSPPLNRCVRNIYYSHDERYAGISDHSSLHILLEFQGRAGSARQRGEIARLQKAQSRRSTGGAEKLK